MIRHGKVRLRPALNCEYRIAGMLGGGGSKIVGMPVAPGGGHLCLRRRPTAALPLSVTLSLLITH